MRTAAAAALVVVSITSGSGTSEAFKVKVGSRNNWFTLHNGMVLTFETDRPLEWRLKAGSAGKLETSGTTVRYVAPTGIPAHNSVAGCQVAPNDSVFNTAIDALPVHAESDAWIVALNTLLKGPVRISFPQGIGINIVNNSTAPARQTFHYTTARNGARYQIPKPPERKRETGALTTDANNDHHMISVNQETCHVYETYQDGLPGENWSAASGWDYDGTSYNSTGRPEDGGGSTDAAALPILPLLLRLSDFESGEIRHAMRFTACVGCISHSSVWPAGGTTGWGKGVPPMGSRWRLKASFDISRFSPRAQIILKALQRYGMIMADIGTVNQIQVSSDFNEDPSAMAALAEASNSALNTSAFEIVDE
ncbi:MAG: hypothetical protein JO061_10660, partial [Acidobacteriaceae bacterium]|nr:hypothetical protein [Acidobacteriaceae bacterium]